MSTPIFYPQDHTIYMVMLVMQYREYRRLHIQN